MQDITGARAVEVSVRDDGKVLWVNVDGLCVLRVCRIDYIEVNDARRKIDREGDRALGPGER